MPMVILNLGLHAVHTQNIYMQTIPETSSGKTDCNGPTIQINVLQHKGRHKCNLLWLRDDSRCQWRAHGMVVTNGPAAALAFLHRGLCY